MIRTALSFVSVLLLSLSAFAGIDEARWPRLIDKAITEGTSMDTDWGTFRTLTKMSADPSATHIADYFSAVGVYGDDGRYTSQVEVVSENWVHREDGTVTVDQWLFSALPEDGRLFRSAHIFMVRTADDSILQYDSVPATDEEIEAEWQKRIDLWQSAL